MAFAISKTFGVCLEDGNRSPDAMEEDTGSGSNLLARTQKRAKNSWCAMHYRRTGRPPDSAYAGIMAHSDRA